MKDWLKYAFIERRKKELMDELYPLVVEWTEHKSLTDEELKKAKAIEEKIYYLDDLLRNRKGGH